MANALLLIGLIIAIGGKFVAIAWIGLVSRDSSLTPWVVFGVFGYLLAFGAALSGGALPGA